MSQILDFLSFTAAAFVFSAIAKVDAFS